MSDSWQLAQLNVGTVRFPLEDPRMHGFVSQLDDINALADDSPGFIWRLQSESGNATDIPVNENPLFIVNMSVWETVEALYEFAYKSAHQKVVVKRRDWFERPADAYQVLWWVPAGHIPTVDEALERLQMLRDTGPGPQAFTFRTKYPPPDADGAPEDLDPAPYCEGWE